MTRPIRLLPAFLTVGMWTMASRVLGFARDILIAAFLGAGPVAEAFFIAFSLPNMFRRFFAEGAFNTAFVPMFSKRVEAGDDPARFARDAFSGLFGILLVFTLLAQLFMPVLVFAMASGFRGDERFDLAVLFGRIAFPYILFISLAALLSGVLNALGRFAAAAAAPVLLNVIFIGGLWFAHLAGFDLGLALAWAVPIAGVAQLVLLWFAAKEAGFALVPSLPRLTPDLKRLAIIAAPAALAGGVVQINLLVGRQVASFFDGAVVWLNLADRLYQLPLGLVGVAIGVVLLPDLSRRLQAGDADGGRDAYNRATEFSLVLTLPAAVALVAMPLPLISVLFERGAFTSTDSAATAAALVVYGLGLPAFVLQKTVTPLFFARADTRRPFRYALVSMVVNAAVAIGLAPFLGYLAAALGTTLAAWANLWLLWRGSQRMGDAARIDARLGRKAPWIALASLVMGISVWAGSELFSAQLAQPFYRYIWLAALVTAGGAIYAIVAIGTGAFTLSEFRKAMKR